MPRIPFPGGRTDVHMDIPSEQEAPRTVSQREPVPLVVTWALQARGGDWRAQWDLVKRRERPWLLGCSFVQISTRGSRKAGESLLEKDGKGLWVQRRCVSNMGHKPTGFIFYPHLEELLLQTLWWSL